MADSFGSTVIEVTSPALEEESALVFSERVIPGGTDTYIDIAGLQPRRLTLELFFPGHPGPPATTGPAEYTAFKALVGTTHLLIYVDAPSPGVSALLVNVKRTKRNLSSAGQTWATAEFRIIT